MKPIKFRAWDGEEMFNYSSLEGFFAHWENNSQWPLMQFTGLQDRSGVDVYEGDILVFDYEEGVNYRPHVVVWDEENASFRKVWDNCWSDFGGASPASIMTVIGNIYEHSHLMEEGG